MTDYVPWKAYLKGLGGVYSLSVLSKHANGSIPVSGSYIKKCECLFGWLTPTAICPTPLLQYAPEFIGGAS